MSFLQRFFYGRNGPDQLSMALLLLGFGLNLLVRFLLHPLFPPLGLAVIAVALFRMISRNIPKRRQENAQFLRLIQRLRAKGPRPGTDTARFRYFKCPGCKQAMRVPRGKGKVKITCSKCGRVFYKKV